MISFLLFVLMCQSPNAGRETDPRDQVKNSDKICGPKCLYILARLKNINLKFADVLDSVMKDPDGCSLNDLHTSSSKFGLKTAMIKSTDGNLDQVPTPAILHLKKTDKVGHFVVLLKTRKGFCTYIDGTTCEIRTSSSDELARNWSGFTLVEQKRFFSGWTQAFFALLTYALAVLVGKPLISSLLVRKSQLS